LHGLRGSSGLIEGFEDDEVMYARVGWPGGPMAPELEVELRERLSRIFREDARRLVEEHDLEMQHKRRSQNDNAFAEWLHRKEVEIRSRNQQLDQQLLPSTPSYHHSQEELDAHYAAWCHKYDAARRQTVNA